MDETRTPQRPGRRSCGCSPATESPRCGCTARTPPTQVDYESPEVAQAWAELAYLHAAGQVAAPEGRFVEAAASTSPSEGCPRCGAPAVDLRPPASEEERRQQAEEAEQLRSEGLAPPRWSEATTLTAEEIASLEALLARQPDLRDRAERVELLREDLGLNLDRPADAERPGAVPLDLAPPSLHDLAPPNPYATAFGSAAIGWRVARYAPGDPAISARYLYFSNGFDLESASPWEDASVRRVVLSVHGKDDNDDDLLLPAIQKNTFESLDANIGAWHSSPRDYAIFAPAFAQASDTYHGNTWPPTALGLANKFDLTNRARMVYWGGTAYAWGKDCANAATVGKVSAFDILRRMIDLAIVRFPNLERVYVIGHSAGGQTAHRFAMADYGALDRKASLGIETRYIPCNGGEWTFLSPHRLVNPAVAAVNIWNWYWAPDPDNGKLAPVDYPRPEHPDARCMNYQQWLIDPVAAVAAAGVPGVSPEVDVEAACSGSAYAYDAGGWGNRWGFSGGLYRDFQRARTGIIAKLGWDANSSHRYVFGRFYLMQDVWHVQSRFDDDVSADQPCGYALQGPSRLHRWWAFFNSLASWGWVNAPARQHFYAADTDKVKHTSKSAFESLAVRKALGLYIGGMSGEAELESERAPDHLPPPLLITCLGKDPANPSP